MFIALPVPAQIGSFSGAVRYEYRYQDYKAGEILTKYSSNSPSFNIRNSGVILSPKLGTYSIFTSLTGIFSNTSSGSFNYTGSQFTWNRYNATLNLLQYSPVRLSLGARENSYDMTAKQEDFGDRSGNRQQEQRAELMVQRIPWLPTMTLTYLRTRSFATDQNTYDFVNQTLSFNASGASDLKGSYTLTAVMSDFRDRESDNGDKYLSVQFGATRTLAVGHDVSMGTEYNKYSGYSIINGMLGYAGTLTERLRTSTSIDGTSSNASGIRSLALGVNEYVTYSFNENFRGGAGAGYSLNTYQSASQNIDYRRFRTSGSIQHNRMIGNIAMSNGLSLGYSEQLSQGNYHSLNSSFSNTLSTTLGAFTSSLDYVFTYANVVTSYTYSVYTNSAGFSLSGILPRRIQSQSSIRYAQDHYAGNDLFFQSRGSLIFTQRLSGEVKILIPLRIGLSGNFNRYFTGLTGKYYGWSGNVSAPSFFIRGVSADYTFSSNFDPYYERDIIVHSASLSVNWRALTISSRFRYSTFPLRTREANVTVSRSF